ncbi:urokinase plasminogen activator surface receptor-like isoform X3 [Scyliorhinus canicula]|uniref:urokinase plasminogen activator surface receptor-like isoform X3 n=1 Tax=Scyliorhinus canicula TaxID=7830 RepID=UPI0018F39452|nr:urokinase plasminogen activator surface receptor-like isoform X3 [Scyliorhinus canicula]
MWRRYLNIFYSGFVLCSVLHEVQPLTCNQCSGMSGTCTFKSSTCKSGTTVCKTTSNTKINGGMTTKRISNSCGPCSDPVSFNCGSVVISQSSNCCDTDRCNIQIDTAPLNDTANGLQCRGCFSNSSDSCRVSEQMVKCVGAQNHCMNVSGITDLSITKSTVTPEISSKGPADSKGNVGCIVGSVVGVIGGFLITVGVCYLCHKNKRASTLKCFNCESPTGKCTQQEVCDPALNLNCRTILARLTVGFFSQVSVINRCGNCTENLSFNGGTLSAAVTEQCCQSDLCNNSITEEANTTLNGIECYRCPELFSSTCQELKEMVQCVGMQTKCLHSSVTYQTQNLIIKGCASESLCENPNALAVHNIQLKQDFYCCKERGCNRGSLVSWDQTTAPVNTVTVNNSNSTAQTFPVISANTATVTNINSTAQTFPMISTNTATVNNSSPAVHSLLALPLIILIPCLF